MNCLSAGNLKRSKDAHSTKRCIWVALFASPQLVVSIRDRGDPTPLSPGRLCIFGGKRSQIRLHSESRNGTFPFESCALLSRRVSYPQEV